MSAFSNAVLTAACIVGILAASPGNAALADSSPSTRPSSATTVKTYHDGSIRDLDGIGNRNVGCGRGLGNWYSIEKQIAMGRSYARQVESTVKLVNDSVVTEYINRLGQNLVRNSDSQVPFTIKVIDSDDVNAFALPGGFFYVDSGLILAADSEAELAGVMAHEIAHVAACHAARENTRGQVMNLASIPLILVGGPVGYAAYEGAGIALPMTFLKFTRGFESDADYLGVEYMYKAGYDPQAFISFFEKVEALEKQKPGTVAKAFATHPQTPDRVEKTQEEIKTILPPKMEYKLDTSEFEDVKARLAQLENRHVPRNENDERRPTLRRASHDDKNDDDDRPTLTRRDERDDFVSRWSAGG
jgi:beta-barrel assembly-enhancing protease